MERELIRLDELFLAAVLDQSLGQLRAFAISDHPAGNVAAEDVEDHVQVEVRPFRRSEQLGDVPAPELIGSRGHQFGLLVGRMKQLIARTRLVASASDTWYGSSSGIALHRATSHKPRLASD